MSLRKRLGTERGTSTLEFIVVLPFLLFIFLVGVELSRAWLTAHIAASAVREGARLGAVTPAASVECELPGTSGVVCTRITDILGTIPISLGPKVTCAACAPDAQVVASVTVQFHTVVPFFLTMLVPANACECLEIKQTATMRYE